MELMYKISEYFSDEFLKCLDDFFSSTSVSEDSMRVYVSRLRTICNSLGKDFLKITEEDARVYFDGLISSCRSGGCKRSSIYSKWTCFNRIGGFIEAYGYIDGFINPFSGISLEVPSADIKYHRIPTQEDVDHILSAAPNKMFYLVFTLAFRTALSLNEIVSLRKCHLSESNGILFIQVAKKSRLLPLPEDVAILMRNYISTMPYEDEEGHLFYNAYNNVLSGVNIRMCFKSILEKLDIDSTYSLKDLRNRCILDMISSSAKAGVDVSVVADYAGIGDKRLNTFEKSASIIRKSPADLVNIRVNPFVEV